MFIRYLKQFIWIRCCSSLDSFSEENTLFFIIKTVNYDNRLLLFSNFKMDFTLMTNSVKMLKSAVFPLRIPEKNMMSTASTYILRSSERPEKRKK